MNSRVNATEQISDNQQTNNQNTYWYLSTDFRRESKFLKTVCFCLSSLKFFLILISFSLTKNLFTQFIFLFFPK